MYGVLAVYCVSIREYVIGIKMHHGHCCIQSVFICANNNSPSPLEPHWCHQSFGFGPSTQTQLKLRRLMPNNVNAS